MKQPVIKMERVYVKVNSDFDSTGYMQPRSITWSDGRVFQIEAVKDFRPAGTHHDSPTCDCYTVVIRGETKYLYFQKVNNQHVSRIGRWYVECPTIT
ncbi:hypothetical protein [Ruminococcus sp.]|uniref:hypothetical protein n=1 Tax=Ruminococcus sp. TaxID=41978 RepID=UPI0025F2BE43|nr:hypothetical protein [Ruminococcus sp.]